MNTQCTKVLEQTVLPIDKDAHGEKKTESLAPTCNATGYNKVICTLCNGVLNEEILPVDKSTHGETETETLVATCKDPGYIREICTVCGDIVSEEILPIDTTSHNWVNGVCTICGEVLYKFQYDAQMTSFGPMTSEVIDGKDWLRVTPVDLSVDGVYTYDLVASNRFVIGKVTITVAEGSMTVSYTVRAFSATIKSEALKIYASKEAMAAGTAVEAKVDEAINVAENFGEDTKVIVSLILVGDYDELDKNLLGLHVKDTVIAEMLANMN
jgi:hypothetical protein